MSLAAFQSEYFFQSLVPIFPEYIPLRRFSCYQISQLVDAIQQSQPQVLGVSLQLSKDATLDAVAFATQNRIFVLHLSGGRTLSWAALQAVRAVFASESCLLAAFDMARLALHVYRLLGCHSRGVDLGTLFSTSARDVWSPSTFIYKKVDPDFYRHAINAVWYGDKEKDVCIRAWLSASLAERFSEAIRWASKIETAQGLRQEELAVACCFIKSVELLEQRRPKQMQNEFEGISGGDRSVTVQNAAYRNLERARLIRRKRTNAERARDEFIHRLLRGEVFLEDSELIQLLWFPTPAILSALGTKQRLSSSVFSHLGLNPSQEQVANAMISGTGPLVIAHGPPGTGKTKTISAAAQYWGQERCPVWVVAQSNAGVKNIALSFAKLEVDFKLIVSKNSFVELNEHIYESISRYIVRSDDLFRNALDAERLLNGSVVILSTLNMLSNPAIKDCRLFDLVPVERLVVDEASQIDAFEFMHLFSEFEELEKLCLFGDPNQLPPYGEKAAPETQTIFDFKHLRTHAYFLDTQYRLPLPLGEFISRHVYHSKLQSKHEVKTLSCIKFVDVAKGVEQREGQSWINTEEIRTIANLARHYYRQKEFCIITPYDAQRRAIQTRLKSKNLPWDMVYNVDSFQGHEAQFVIVSTVRTYDAGFLQNRMNVMLTRCQAGMVIVTNRQFLFTGSGRGTLLGMMAQHWERRLGRTQSWTTPSLISNQAIDLPGAPGKITESHPPRESIPLATSVPLSVRLALRQREQSVIGTPEFWRNLDLVLSTLPPWQRLAPRSISSSTSYNPAASGARRNQTGEQILRGNSIASLGAAKKS